MAKERVSRTICDRCGSVVEEVDTQTKVDSTVDVPPILYLEVKGEEVLSFEDLCSKCNDRIAALVKDMAPGVKASKKKGPKEKKPQKPQPKQKGSQASAPPN